MSCWYLVSSIIVVGFYLFILNFFSFFVLFFEMAMFTNLTRKQKMNFNENHNKQMKIII